MTSRHPDYIRCRRDEREQAHRSAVSFDVSDAKGRVIGYRTMIDREVWVADEASNTSWDKKWVGCEIFRLQPQATRSGVDYGASLNASVHYTLEDAKAKADAMIAAYRKKMTKQFA